MQVDISHRLLKIFIENGKSFVSVNLTIHSLPMAVYATKVYNKGDIVAKLQGILVLHPTRESIHIGNGMHIIDKYGKFINHSFEPNTKIELNDIIAIKDIKPYEEITFDYNSSEINMAEPFEVNGVKVCGKQI